MLRNPWAGVAILLALLVTLMLALYLLKRRFALHPETTRKAAHIGLGLTTLSFPFLFTSVWPVVIVALVTVVVLGAVRSIPALGTRFGGVVHGVGRSSAGDLYFPIAAVGLFVLAQGDPVLFGIPILTLALADAVAAIVGIHYGRLRYQTGEEPKTLEGSIAFFSVAFLTTHIPLLLATTTGRMESVLIGLMFGIIVMLLEAVSLRGTDNLLIPFGGYLLLAGFLQRSATDLALALLVMVFLLALVLVLRKRRTLSDTAVLAAALFGFVSWAVGGWRWLLPPIVLFLSYTIVWPRARMVRQRPHDLVAVAAVVSSALIWLVLAFALSRPDLYYPYTISLAANLCFVGISWFRTARPRMHPVMRAAQSALVAWAVIFPLYAILVRPREGAITATVAALVCLIAGGLAFTWLVPPTPGLHDGPYPWLRQAVIGFGASVLGLAVLPLAFAAP